MSCFSLVPLANNILRRQNLFPLLFKTKLSVWPMTSKIINFQYFLFLRKIEVCFVDSVRVFNCNEGC